MSLSKVISDYDEALPGWVHSDCIFPALKDTLLDSGYLNTEQDLEELEQYCIQKGCLVAKLNYLLHLSRNKLKSNKLIFNEVNEILTSVENHRNYPSSLYLETVGHSMLSEAASLEHEG
jgi:hypothetical protein